MIRLFREKMYFALKPNLIEINYKMTIVDSSIHCSLNLRGRVRQRLYIQFLADIKCFKSWLKMNMQNAISHYRQFTQFYD